LKAEFPLYPAGWGRRELTAANKFHWIVLKMRQAQTFLATIENNHCPMKTLAMISVLALLTISGAAYTDQLFTSGQQVAQRAN
jgi:hypothetical protein